MEPTQNTKDKHSMQPLGAAASPHSDSGYFGATAELRTALEDVYESVEVLLQRTNGFLARQAEQQPHILLAGAAGLGFVLGGGLASRTGGMVARAAGRLLFAHFVQRIARGGAEAATTSPSANPAF